MTFDEHADLFGIYPMITCCLFQLFGAHNLWQVNMYDSLVFIRIKSIKYAAYIKTI